MPSSTVENYLKAIYLRSVEQGLTEVAMGDLAATLAQADALWDRLSSGDVGGRS